MKTPHRSPLPQKRAESAKATLYPMGQYSSSASMARLAWLCAGVLLLALALAARAHPTSAEALTALLGKDHYRSVITRHHQKFLASANARRKSPLPARVDAAHPHLPFSPFCLLDGLIVISCPFYS